MDIHAVADDFARALDAAIAATGVHRYRHLCLEHPDPAVRESYRRLVREIAAEGRPPRPPVAESIRLARGTRACPYRSADPGCGCSGSRCALRKGAIVSHVDCFECLRRYPD